jgi:alkylation response protein AidB-like acyl-CoA dehydrogenase
MTTIPIEDFLASAEAWLAARYPAAVTAGRRFTWGEGDDEVRVFQEPDPVAEAGALPAIRRWRQDLWDAGYAWIDGPPEYGGAGLPAAYARGFEQLARRYQVPGDAALTVSLGMIAPTILRHGTEEQRLHWLPLLYSGQQIACQLFSEPGAGSDLAAVSTRAVPDGSRWRISGQKVWTSGAHLADIGEILCRTADEPRHRNLTAFLISMDAPGVTVRPLRQMTGGAAFNEVFLDDVPADDQRRLGPAGDGWKVALTTLGYERRAMGHSAFGGAGILSTERLTGLVRAMNKDGDPVVRQEFGELISRLRTARYLQEVQAAQARAGEPAGPELALGKIALSDNFRRLAAFVADVIGPEAVADTGAWGTYAWTSVLLGAPGYRLGGGTDEIIKTTVAQRALGLPRAT